MAHGHAGRTVMPVARWCLPHRDVSCRRSFCSAYWTLNGMLNERTAW